MKCAELMKRDLHTARDDDSLQVVAMAMLQHATDFVPVADFEGHFKGALTERALLAHVVATGRESHALKAGNLAHELPTVGPDDEAPVAEQKMREAKKTRAAVVDAEHHLLGIVSLADLASPPGGAGASAH